MRAPWRPRAVPLYEVHAFIAYPGQIGRTVPSFLVQADTQVAAANRALTVLTTVVPPEGLARGTRITVRAYLRDGDVVVTETPATVEKVIL